MMTGQNERQRSSVLLISNDENPDYYRFLQIKGEKVERCSFGCYEDRLSFCEASVIVLDSGNEVWRGLSALRQIKQAHPEVPIIFLSVQRSDETVASAMKLGAQEYYQKPVNVIRLQQLVANLVAIRQPTRRDNILVANMSAGETLAPHDKTIFPYKPQNILQVISFIESNLWSSMELEGLAQKANLSKFHFCRVFKKYTGMNPMKYVNSLRISRAKELLAGNKNRVSLVANEVGFRDLSNFIRQFKKNTGVTPTAYRHMSQSQNTPAATAFADRQQATIEQ
jgi:AraC family transcriptional regulator